PDGRAVTRRGPHVDPVQLQVACTSLWEKWRRRKPGANAIGLDDVEGGARIDDALAEFYRERVRAAAEASGVRERVIREWIDRWLITEHGLRSQVTLGPTSTAGLPNAVLDLLVDGYI